jgi:hypothetical protein
MRALLLAAMLLGSAPPKKGAPVRVRAEEVEYDYKGHRAVGTGKPLVSLIRDDATLVCKKLVAELDDQGAVKKAVCRGDVKLTRGARVVTCDLGTWDEEKDLVTCEGNPVLRDGESVFECERVEYDLVLDKAKMVKAKGVVVPRPGEELPGGKKKKGAGK